MPLRIKVPKLPKIELVKPLTSPDDDRQARWKAWSQHPGDAYALFICWEYLTKTKRLKERQDFLYRSRYGGDFYFPGRKLAWFLRGNSVKLTPALAYTTARLRSEGTIVVQLRSQDVEQRTVYTLEKALRGIQIAR